MTQQFRQGVRLGVDVGSVRVGLALTDPDCILATPHQTVTRDKDRRKRFDVKIVTRVCEEFHVVTVYVGLPRSLNGQENSSTGMAREYAAALQSRLRSRRCGTTVRLVDERLSTVSAHQSLLDAGVSRRQHMDKVDQVAAVTFLQAAIDQGRTMGVEPGFPIDS